MLSWVTIWYSNPDIGVIDMGQEQGIAFQKEEGLYWRGKKWNNYSVLAGYSL